MEVHFIRDRAEMAARALLGQQPGHLRIGGSRRGMKLQAVVRRGNEHAVECKRVEVDVQVERPAEALDDRQAAAPAGADAEPARAAALEAEEGVWT